MIIWLSGLQTIPDELYEAARMDGATPWQQFTNVTWPGLRPTMVFVLVTITIAALGLFVQIDVMTQGGPSGLDDDDRLPRRPQGVPSSRRSATAPRSRSSSSCLVLVIALVQRRLTREKD